MKKKQIAEVKDLSDIKVMVVGKGFDCVIADMIIAELLSRNLVLLVTINY